MPQKPAFPNVLPTSRGNPSIPCAFQGSKRKVPALSQEFSGNLQRVNAVLLLQNDTPRRALPTLTSGRRSPTGRDEKRKAVSDLLRADNEVLTKPNYQAQRRQRSITGNSLSQTVPGDSFIRTFDFWRSVGYNDPRKTKGGTGVKQKRSVEMTRQEWRLAMEGLNWFHNELIAAGR